jgi:REP element-mobilizing transposase RayT
MAKRRRASRPRSPRAPRRTRSRAAQQSWAFRAAPRRRGRPRKLGPAHWTHKTRPALDARHPVHVTLRTVAAVGELRTRHAYHAIRYALYAVIPRGDFRIVHLSIQHDHVHLIVEAADKHALARGMQAFQISAAQRLNRAHSARFGRRRKGTVFPERYHARALTSPTAVRHALAYVLNNWRKHRLDRGAPRARKVDPYSSGINFAGWHELGDSPLLYEPPRGFQRLSTCRPRTWLLSRGWQRAGAISVYERPAAT